MAPSEIVGIVQRYLRLLKENGVNAQKAVLYGSRARGDAAEHSDIDLLILSPDFGADRVREGQFLFKMARRVDARIEPVPVHPSEYVAIPDSPLLHFAQQEGMEILPS